jgi:ElaB/YqjD/DUF883 family membrane-anchored ribosome-binding protein
MMDATNNGTAEKVQDAAQDMSQDLRELGRELRQRANDARTQVVKQLFSAAEGIRKEAHEAKNDDVKRSADEVAKGLEKAAAYLNSHSLENMGEEAVRVVRRSPMRAVLVAFIIGLLLGMMLRGDKK